VCCGKVRFCVFSNGLGILAGECQDIRSSLEVVLVIPGLGYAVKPGEWVSV